MLSLIPPQPVAIPITILPFLFAVFQGTMLAVVLWIKKSSIGVDGHLANRLLACLLLVLCLLLLDHSADITGFYFYVPTLINIIEPLNLLVGPLLWGYISIQTSPIELRLRLHHFWHLIPAVLQLCIVLPFVLNDQSDAKLLFFYESWFPDMDIVSDSISKNCPSYLPWNWNECLTTINQVGGQSHYDLHLRTPLAIIWLSGASVVLLWISLIAYISSSVVLLRKHKTTIQQLSSSFVAKDLGWLANFMAMLAIAAVIYVTASFQEEFTESVWLEMDVRETIVYSILSVSIIYLGVLAVLQPIIFSDDIRIDPPLNKELSMNTYQFTVDKQKNVSALKPITKNADKKPESKEKYRNSPLTKEMLSEMKVQLEHHLETYKSYKDPELSLKKLSDDIGIGPHILSQLINESTGMNFFNFINGYRLETVKQSLTSISNDSILQIATDAGFNSKSSFYQFFRKKEGMSPKQWRNLHRVVN